jgi:hypothetical protein
MILTIVGLGVWAGFRASQAESRETQFFTGLAIFLTCHLLFCVVVWYRAPAGSGDAVLMPVVALMSSAFLAGILPRVFWPAAERAHLLGTIATSVVVIVTMLRFRRRVRRRARAA